MIEAAIAEAHRRRSGSDADVGAEVEHYQRTLPIVAQAWQLTPVQWLPGGVTVPPMAVTMSDGVDAVLKIQPPGRLDVAAQVLIAAAGDGYVRVLAWDPGHGALLTERLGEELWQHSPDLIGQARVIVPLLRRAWRVPLSSGESIGGKAEGLRQVLARLGDRYGGEAPTARLLAERYASQLAADEAAEVVCHGDPHANNVLRRGTGWALIDCDGFIGERAYDLGVVLRDGCAEFERAESARPGTGVELLGDGCRRLAGLSGVDANRVWRWGFTERVTTGLYLYWLGHPDEGARFLRTAETIAQTVG